MERYVKRDNSMYVLYEHTHTLGGEIMFTVTIIKPDGWIGGHSEKISEVGLKSNFKEVSQKEFRKWCIVETLKNG